MEVRRRVKRSLFLAWVGALGLAALALRRSGVSAGELPELLAHGLRAHGAWGPAAYVLAYALRPATLLPASFMTLAGGLLFGPAAGILYTLVGENLSAAVGFWLARALGREWFTGLGGDVLARLEAHLDAHGFVTVLSLRLLNLPFDVVSFACGLTRMAFADFAYGTFLGVLPGTAAFVFFGAAWREPRNLLIGGAFLALSLGLARAVRREEPVSELSKELKRPEG